NDLFFKNVVQLLAFELVLNVAVGIAFAAADGPSQVGGVAFDPPSIQDRAIGHAIGRGLHTAGTAGLHSAARCVEPDVHALDKHTGDVDVVILEEDNSPADCRITGEVDQGLDQLLAFVI